MADMDDVEKQIDEMKIQIQAIALMLGVNINEPPEWYTNGTYGERPNLHIVDNETIEELTDPDA